MGRNQVRVHVSDSVEHEFDKLHRIADRYMVYPLAAVEGAVQGVARGFHNLVTHKHPSDRLVTGRPPPAAPAYQHPVQPYVCYGYPLPPPPAAAPPPQFQYHPAYPVPCRPPF
ncbi:hypothetical protein COLO4_34638 [Corchorus olitorius]|uniref:Uncharacterized protein n=1 Tax=Corchorus olitorius TaxID=93759 RepID=A0A1R3GK18_9ROSI|nr:hypothetical protein COLO4_34638 [Corchorus olitorius]